MLRMISGRCLWLLKCDNIWYQHMIIWSQEKSIATCSHDVYMPTPYTHWVAENVCMQNFIIALEQVDEGFLFCLYSYIRYKQTYTSNNNNISNNKQSNIHMMVLYTKGLSESLKNICGKMGIHIHFKRANTIRCLLVPPKDKDSITQKNGIIYRYKWNGLDCDKEYIGKSTRTFRERLKAYFRHLSYLWPCHLLWSLYHNT